MDEARPARRKSRVFAALAWASAAMLPCVSAAATTHVHLLDKIPAALLLASIAVTAWFGLALPTVLAIVLSMVLYNYFIAPPLGHWSTDPAELVREGVLLCVAGLIAFLSIRLRRAQAALARSEAFHRTTLASIGDGVIATDNAGNVTFMNSVAEQLTGWTEAETKTQPLAAFFRISSEETGEPVESPVGEVRRRGTTVAMANHTQLERRDGVLLPIDDSAAPIRTPDGQSAGIVLVFREVTERRNTERVHNSLLERAQAAENELREAIDLYRDQVQALGLAQQAGKCAAWVMDAKRPEVKFLPGGFEIFGIPFADLGDIQPIEFVEPEDRPGILASLRSTIETGTPFQPEFRVRWPNGELRWQEARGIRDPELPHIVRGTTFDITERKRAELSLLQIEKLAAVGRIASTIAHEVNNPLASVTNLLYLALLDSSLTEPVRGYLQTADQELSRLRNVTRLTLSYARPQHQAREIDPSEIIDSVLLLFRIRFEGKGIRVVRVGAAPVRVRIYIDELQRILTNLIANAIDAVGLSGGVIRIVAEQIDQHACLAIEDNGAGIPPESLDRIFDPFFTTKEEVGTGIGLWVTKELVEKNGGSISFASGDLENGIRTRFVVRFPVPAPTAPQAAS